MRYYLAVIERGHTGYGVFFPEVSGCVSAGDTIQEAADGAREALEGHLDLLAEDGDPFPEPTGIVDVPVDPKVKEVCRVLVPYQGEGKAVRVNINLPHNLLLQMDRYAAANGLTRSGLIALAAREKISHQ